MTHQLFAEQDVTVGTYRFHLRFWAASPEDHRYTDARTPEDSKTQQPPVLFLHGFMGSADDWQHVIEHWSDRPSCIALDLPGHGETDVLGGKECYQIPHVAAGIVQLLDILQIHQCFLVGYSMGGRLSLYLALHYAERFYRVVIESASPGLKTQAERQSRREWDETIAHALETIDFHTFLNRWYQQPLFASLRHHPAFSTMLKRRSRNSPRLLGRSLRHMGTGQQPSLWPALLENMTPILLIVGEWDQKYRDIATEMSDRHHVLEVAVVPSCGHNVHLERPAQFVENLRQFLGPHPSAGIAK